MLRFSLAVLSLSIGLFACGDDGGETPQADAPVITATVEAVTCPATPDAAVTTNAGGTAFDPAATTISVNQIVEFTMPSSHNVVPNAAGGMTDPGLTVNFNETKCLKFTATGTFHFKCNPHGFVGTITVQ